MKFEHINVRQNRQKEKVGNFNNALLVRGRSDKRLLCGERLNQTRGVFFPYSLVECGYYTQPQITYTLISPKDK